MRRQLFGTKLTQIHYLVTSKSCHSISFRRQFRLLECHQVCHHEQNNPWIECLTVTHTKPNGAGGAGRPPKCCQSRKVVTEGVLVRHLALNLELEGGWDGCIKQSHYNVSFHITVIHVHEFWMNEHMDRMIHMERVCFHLPSRLQLWWLQ